VKAYLKDSRFMGSSMFDDDGEPLNPTRPLVRLGIARSDRSEHDARDRRRARRYLTQLVRENRPALERCYEEVLARAPVMAAELRLAVQLDAEGEVEGLRVADGHLGDAHGDACVYWAIARADSQAERPDLTEAVELELPVTFFVQSERTIEDTRWHGWGGAYGQDGSSIGDATATYELDRERHMQDMGARRGRHGQP
jgi:hypothetical protein